MADICYIGSPGLCMLKNYLQEDLSVKWKPMATIVCL